MAYSIQFEGFDELQEKLDKLGEKGQQIAAQALYEGAGVVADTVSKAMHGIATSPFKYARGGQTRLPSPEEKAIYMKASVGVSKFRKNGVEVQTSIGTRRGGYAAIKWSHARSGIRTKYKMGFGGKYQNTYSQEGKSSGRSVKPIEVIVNAIESGTSFMNAQPDARKAYRQSRSKALATIEKELEERIKDLELEG